MKAKKIVIGAAAAAMFSLAVCSVVPAGAATGTVQISVGSATVDAGEQFAIEVSLKDIPADGIQACNFSLEFDNSLITVDSVTAGTLTETGAGASDSSSSLLPNFNSYVDNNEGLISVMWSTSLDDASKWLKGEGVLCTIQGKAADSASGKAEVSLVATKRDTYTGSGVANQTIDCGYVKNGETVKYDVQLTNGAVNIKADVINPDVVKGDANCDGKVTLADAVAVLQNLANKDKYGLSDQGKLNADVDGDPGITANDALKIQQYDAKIIESF